MWLGRACSPHACPHTQGFIDDTDVGRLSVGLFGPKFRVLVWYGSGMDHFAFAIFAARRFRRRAGFDFAFGL